MKKMLFIALLLLSTSIYAFNDQVGIPIVNQYSAIEYQAGSQNWCITQSNNGLIYVANNFGLLEFDGVKWSTHTLHKGNNNLKSVLAVDDKIFVGGQHEFGYFEQDNSKNLHYISLLPLLEDKQTFDEIWNIYKGQDENEIIFSSHRKIFIYNGQSIRVITPPKEIHYSFYINGDFLSSAPEIGLLNWNSHRILPQYKGTELLKGSMVRSIIKLFNGSLLSFTHKGEIFINKGSGFEPWAKDTWDNFSRSKINTAQLLKDNTIAIATQNDGLYILNTEGKVLLHINKKNGLTDFAIYHIFQDQTENLWLAHRNGLSYIELHSPFSLINERVGIEGGGYSASFYKNQLYLGTSNGVFQFLPKGKFKEPYYEKINIGHTYNLSVTNDTLFQGQHEGLYSYANQNNELINPQKGAWNMIYIPEQNAYLQGAYDGIFIHRRINNKWVSKKLDGFKESSRLIEIENQNTLWMSHGFKGVYKLEIDFENNKVIKNSFYNKEKGFYSNVLINLFKVNNELIFGGENGIYIYNEKNDRFELHEKYNTLLGKKRISSMVNDLDGNVFFIQENKVGAIYDMKSSKPYVERNIFERINKYLSDDLESIIVLGHSHILFTAKEGFIHFNSRFKRRVQNNIPLNITSFKSSNGIDIKNELSNSNNNTSIEFENNDINFTYATAFFDGLENNSYQTFLEGFDKLPKEWSALNTITYTNLKEGKYTFNVIAKNIYGEKSSAQQIAFTILPPWYRTPLAYGVYLFGFMCLLFLIIKLSNKRYNKKWLNILGQKEQQIEDQDGTIKKLLHEKHHQEIDFKNKELALSAFHLSQRNALLTSLKNDLIKVSSSAIDVQVAKDIHHLANRINKEIDDEKEWSRFKNHFNLIHSNFFEYFKNNYPQLSTQELKICAYIKMNMSTKDIANALNLSVRGIETSRYRLRKKLDLDKGDNLLDFIADLETKIEEEI